MCDHSVLGLFADAATEGASWIMDLVTWISVYQQLDCTIKELHVGCLHGGWVEQQSEAWGRVGQIGNAVVPSKIIFSFLFSS